MKTAAHNLTLSSEQLVTLLSERNASVHTIAYELDIKQEDLSVKAPANEKFFFSTGLLKRWYANLHASLFLELYNSFHARFDGHRALCLVITFDEYLGNYDGDMALDINQCSMLLRYYQAGLIVRRECNNCFRVFYVAKNDSSQTCPGCTI